MLHKLSLLLAAWLIASISWAAQPAFTVAETPLKSAPQNGASTLLELDAEAPVLILERQGGWYRVQTAASAQSGWVKLHQLRYASEHSGSSENFLELALGDSSPTVATGVRGLSEAELNAGVTQSMTMQRVNRYHVSTTEARSFAASGNLRTKSISYGPGARP